MTEVEYLNHWLEGQGLSITGEVLYRIVWSDKMMEMRHGLYEDYSPGGLFIRSVRETRLAKKYNYIKERWILEKWAPGNLTAHSELPNATNGDYIPVYVFEDKNGNYLPPNERAVKFIIDFMNGRIDQDAKVDPDFLEQKEVEYQVDTMMDAPDFRTTGQTRNAIAYTRGLKGIKDFKNVSE